MKVISNRVGPGTGRHLTYSALMTGVFLMISLYHGTVLASEVKTGREIVIGCGVARHQESMR